MKTVNIQAAKTHLSRLVEEAAGGEEIVLAKAGKPLVRLIPYNGDVEGQPKVPGIPAGQGWEADDSWEATDPGVLKSIDEPLSPSAVEEPPLVSETDLMPAPGAAGAIQDLGRLLRSVRAGKRVVILDQGVPVARLEPVSIVTLADESRLRALEGRGLLRGKPLPAHFAARLRKLPAPKVGSPGAVAALLADRAEDTR